MEIGTISIGALSRPNQRGRTVTATGEEVARAQTSDSRLQAVSGFFSADGDVILDDVALDDLWWIDPNGWLLGLHGHGSERQTDLSLVA